MPEKEIITTGYKGNSIQFIEPDEGSELLYTAERFLEYLTENFDNGYDIILKGIPSDLS